jgi:DnaJ-domain-containing protein 1
VSISKRFFNFARSELNSLLERASELDDREGEPDFSSDADPAADPTAPPTTTPPRGRRKVRLEDLSDEELEAEIERRRLDKELNDRAARASRTSPGGAGRERPRTNPTPSGVDPIAKAYAALEIPNGSDFETVRKSYRALMRKYHPDRHTATPDKQKAANELAQKLTDAYKTLERRLRPPTVP